MAYARKKLPSFFGTGNLKYRGFEGTVDYEILGDPAGLRYGPLRLRGSFNADPTVAEQAFREGEGVLTLEAGQAFRVTFIGHSTGSNTAYFEMRV
jgi:hypothetical protein